MRKKSILAVAMCTAALAGASASAAFAGEVNGNGDPTGARTNSNSICSYSGQNDGNPPPGRKAAHVQNWGQIPKEARDEIKAEEGAPGDECHGGTNPNRA